MSDDKNKKNVAISIKSELALTDSSNQYGQFFIKIEQYLIVCICTLIIIYQLNVYVYGCDSKSLPLSKKKKINHSPSKGIKGKNTSGLFKRSFLRNIRYKN